jgi:hypothetical protein
MPRPIWVYDNWTAYTDGFAGLDETRLTEDFALEHLRHVVRARQRGVRIDVYMMNAFWYQPDGGYRVWRRPDWPDGPDRWLDGCAEAGVAPGLWFGSNTLWKLEAAAPWRDSVDPTTGPDRYGIGGAMSFSDGGFFPDFLDTLQHWYDRGVRMFEFDCAEFDAGTARQRDTMTADEIRELNVATFTGALGDFRRRNPGAMLVGFNGYGGEIETTSSPVPFEHAVDPRFPELFESIYTGDLRVSDVPHESFWRSMDMYTDHMLRRYEANGVPLHKADPLGFVMSTTWFGAERGATAVRGQAVLTAARGSVKKTLYGDLGLLSDDQARFLARVQELYAPLLENGTTESFGGMPGETDPYGFVSWDATGGMHTVVNPTQRVARVALPSRGPEGARVLFADSGFAPSVDGDVVTVGPGQLALVGTGCFAVPDNDLGVEPDVVIPSGIAPIAADFRPTGDGGNAVVASFSAPPGTGVRIVLRQVGTDGWAHRTVEFVTVTAERLGIDASLRGRSFAIEAMQGGRSLTIERSDVVAEFYGTSWAVAEIPAAEMRAGEPVTVTCRSRDAGEVTLEVAAYAVTF